jgi:nucleoporin POM152
MPPQQTGGIPAAHRRARIPSSRMEFHVQRRWAAAIFAALQAYKMTDLVLVYAAVYPEQHGGLLLKWLFYDTAYLIALFFVQIPWLQFTLVKTLFLITFMVIFNVVLFTVPTVSSVTILPADLSDNFFYCYIGRFDWIVF